MVMVRHARLSADCAILLQQEYDSLLTRPKELSWFFVAAAAWEIMGASCDPRDDLRINGA